MPGNDRRRAIACGENAGRIEKFVADDFRDEHRAVGGEENCEHLEIIG